MHNLRPCAFAPKAAHIICQAPEHVAALAVRATWRDCLPNGSLYGCGYDHHGGIGYMLCLLAPEHVAALAVRATWRECLPNGSLYGCGYDHHGGIGYMLCLLAPEHAAALVVWALGWWKRAASACCTHAAHAAPEVKGLGCPCSCRAAPGYAHTLLTLLLR